MKRIKMNLKKYAVQTGRPLKEIEGVYESALKEAKKLGTNDENFIEETLKIILEVDSENRPETIKKLNDAFLKSGEVDFSKFLHNKINEDKLEELSMSPINSIGYIGYTPTDNPIAVIPMPPRKDKKDKDKDYVKPKEDPAGRIDVGVPGIDEMPDSESEEEADELGIIDLKTKSIKDIKKGK
jgi:hypothetical protein